MNCQKGFQRVIDQLYTNGDLNSFDKTTGKIRAMKGYIFDKEENLKKIEEEVKNEINKRKEMGKDSTKFLV